MNISKLVKSKQYIFISPHLDDAILSAGALINHLSSIGKVKIITVFTKSSKKKTKATEEFIRLCHYSNSDKLFFNRRKEDKKVCKYLKVDYLHLGFTDALWREGYRSIREVFLNKINNTKKEQNLEKLIIRKLKKTIKNKKNTVIFAPLSIGNHIDHRIINKICRDNFTNVIYWEDYPYNLKSSQAEELVKNNSLSNFEFDKNLYNKDKLIRFYKSQISMLFADQSIPLKKEKYYFL